MIQRIQSIFILLAAVFSALLLILPIADILADNQEYVFKSLGIYQGANLVFNGLPVFIFAGLITILHLVALFSYKKRVRQIRILIFTILILMGLFGLFYYFSFASFNDEIVSFRFTVAFPIAACILDYLAIRAIGKDEALIQSMNRIR